MKKLFLALRSASLGTVFFLSSASVASAQQAGQINKSLLQGFANDITGIINNILVPLLLTVAFIVFIYGVFTYFILGGADEKKRGTGRVYTLYGIIGFAIIFAVWGLVYLLVAALGLPLGGDARGQNLTVPSLNPSYQR